MGTSAYCRQIGHDQRLSYSRSYFCLIRRCIIDEVDKASLNKQTKQVKRNIIIDYFCWEPTSTRTRLWWWL